MQILAQALDGLGIAGTLGADEDGYPGILGYRGPTLSEVTRASVVSLADESRA